MDHQATLLTHRRPLAPWLLGCAFAALLPSLLFAHGNKGVRDIAVFDVSAAPTVPESVARAFSNGMEGAFSSGAAAGQNECISIKTMRMRLLGGMSLLPMPRNFDGATFDYVLWGEITGAEGAFQYSIRLATARSRTPLLNASGTFARAAEANAAGVTAASRIVNSQGHVREAIRVFERARRSQNADYAMGPTLSLTPPQATLEAGQSATFSVVLKDCDGTLLAQRAVEPRVGEGTVAPRQIQTDDNGSGKFTFTAPGKRGLTHADAYFGYYRPSERPGTSLLEGAGIKVVRPAEYEPAVWNASIVIRRVADGRVKTWENVPAPFGASSRVHESIDPLRVEFKIDRHRRPLPGESASYDWKYEMVTTRSGSPFVSQKGNERGTKLGFEDNGAWVNGWEFSLKRNLRPAERVPELNVHDEDGPAADLLAQIAARREELLPGEAPANNCVLEAKAVFPGKATTVNGMSGETETADSRPTIEESVTIEPYRYDQRQQIKLVDLPLAQAGPDLGTSKRSFHYDLTFLPKFDFEPTDFVISIDGEDFTEKFKLRKFWRDWRTSLIANDLDATRLGPYILFADWETGEDPMSNPFSQAQRLAKERADDPNLVWPTMRWLREYLVQVEDFPEMGFFYYVLTWETSPPQIFRVYRYKPFRITAEEWRQAKFGTQPFRTEDKGAGDVINSYR